jgi:hypothetical protein
VRRHKYCAWKHGQKIEDLEFRLPHPAQTAITGTVHWLNGSPAQATVSLRDLDYPEEGSQVDAAETKADGAFSMTGAEGRPYVVFAHVEIGDQHFHSALVEVHPMGGKPIHLLITSKEATGDCAICKRFKTFGPMPNWKPAGDDK